jgi:hypothetical protein
MHLNTPSPRWCSLINLWHKCAFFGLFLNPLALPLFSCCFIHHGPFHESLLNLFTFRFPLCQLQSACAQLRRVRNALLGINLCTQLVYVEMSLEVSLVVFR